MQVLIAGRAYREKQLYLTPEEAAGFEESGRVFLEQMYRRITSNLPDYEGRFKEQ